MARATGAVSGLEGRAPGDLDGAAVPRWPVEGAMGAVPGRGGGGALMWMLHWLARAVGAVPGRDGPVEPMVRAMGAVPGRDPVAELSGKEGRDPTSEEGA